jgi:dipeptidase
VPSGYAAGTSTYSVDSPWWWANRVKLLCDLNSRALGPTVRGIFDLTEQWEMQRQKRYEAEVIKLIREGRETEAVLLLQGFINENCARIEKEYKMLNQTLPTMLDTVGVEYVFTDYLKGWSSKNKVPLPIR